MRQVSLALALAVALCAPLAWAQTDEERAVMALDRQAAELFEAGAYEQALERMHVAQDILPSSARLYNIAVCNERLGNISGALLNYRRFVAEDDVPEDRAARAGTYRGAGGPKRRPGQSCLVSQPLVYRRHRRRPPAVVARVVLHTARRVHRVRHRGSHHRRRGAVTPSRLRADHPGQR
jgi:tetratricopeptide (TPR) repeat protein